MKDPDSCAARRHFMNLKRTATIVVVGGALAVWLAAGATSPSRGTAPPASYSPAPLDLRGEALASEIARLHERLRPTATPRGNRNLFEFAAAKRRLASESTRPPLTESAAVAAMPAPPPPMIKLVGIAEDEDPTGTVRTAILSGPGQLWLAKEGEQATPRYRVVRIGLDVVELADTSDGSTLRLTLR